MRMVMKRQNDARLLASCLVGDSESTENHQFIRRPDEAGDVELIPVFPGNVFLQMS